MLKEKRTSKGNFLVGVMSLWLKEVDSTGISDMLKENNDLQKQIKEIDTLFENKNRKMIHELAQKHKYNISELADKVGIAYKNAFFHVKLLEEYGLITTHKQENKQGREVIVSAKAHSNKEVEALKQLLIKRQQLLQNTIIEVLSKDINKSPKEMTLQELKNQHKRLEQELLELENKLAEVKKEPIVKTVKS